MARVRGTITGIMESWPIQLAIRDVDGREFVISLEEDTGVVTRQGVVGVSELREGLRVEVEIEDGDDGGSATDDVVVLD